MAVSEPVVPCLREDDVFRPELDVELKMHSGTVGPREHEFYVVLYMLRGSCTITLEGKPCTLRRGMLLLLSPMIELSIPELTQDEKLLILSVRHSTFAAVQTTLLREQGILPDFFRNSLYDASHGALLIPMRQDPEVERLMLRMLWDQSGEQQYLSPLLNALLSELLALLLRHYSEQAQMLALETRELRLTITPILSYIQDHVETVTLGEVARQFHYAEPYLSRMLKEYTGRGFSVYVRQLRMARAQALLENSGLSVGDVAEMVGYSSASYFYSAFREEYGLTPSQFRRNRQEQK